MRKHSRPWDSNDLGVLALAVAALTGALWLTLSYWIDQERGWVRMPRGGRTGSATSPTTPTCSQKNSTGPCCSTCGLPAPC
nr:hypothetical protein [Pseudomonas sp. BIGb0427]